MNGVKNKLQNDDVKTMMKRYDVLVLSETHFAQRIKCPDDFTFISRSDEVLSKKTTPGHRRFLSQSQFEQQPAGKEYYSWALN